MMTPLMLAKCTGANSTRATLFAPFITSVMDEYDIDSIARQSAFLAQIAHESGGLVYTKEIWGPTVAQRGYEGRVDLGNVKPGDGFRYRGRGLIQTTGRANYQRTGFALGVDLETFPDLLAEPGLAARSAGCFWAAHNLNAIADSGDFERLTRKINGGINGLADRRRLWLGAQNALTFGEPDAPV